MGVQGERSRRGGVGSLNSEAVKRALEELAAFNEGSENYYVEERQRILDKIAEQRKVVREERARGVFSRDGNEPTLEQYRLLRLGTLLRNLRRDETQFHQRRAEEEREIERLGLVKYLKTLDGHRTFGPDTYRNSSRKPRCFSPGMNAARPLAVKYSLRPIV